MSHDFFSFFICNIKKLIILCVSAKENYYDLTKNSPEFQANVTERCTSLSKCYRMFRENLLKVPVKNRIFKKPLLHMNFFTSGFWGFQEDFFHLFSSPPIYRSLFVSRIAHVFCICIHICKRYITSCFYYSRDGKQKKNKSYFLDYIYCLICSFTAWFTLIHLPRPKLSLSFA